MVTPFEKLLKIKELLPKDKKEAKDAKEAQEAKDAREAKEAREEALEKQNPANPEGAPGPDNKFPSLENIPNQEMELFLREMDGVTPLSTDKPRVPPPSPDVKAFVDQDAIDEDQRVLIQLRELVSGQGEFDLSFTDEYIEGYSKSLPTDTRELLKLGRYPIEDKLDLHGRILKDALEDIRGFFHKAVFEGKRTVLVIHGRGNRSPDKIPVIKNSLQELLLKNPLKRYILAFVTALPSDGGFGAMYVLLKKRSRVLPSARRRED